MEIQWPLALFTLLTGMGGCTFLFVCINEFTRFSKKSPLVPSIVAFALAVAGGFCSVLHLSHPDRIMNALNRPASGIFVEAALVGLMCVFVAVFVVLERRGRRDGAAAKACAALGALFGVALSFMAGHSYVMVAYDTWNTQLLPIGYLGTALPMGAALYWAVACRDAENGSRFAALATAVCGLVAVASVAAYALVADGFATAPAFYGGSIALACAAVACGLVAAKRPSIALACAAAVCSMGGGLLYRVAMWAMGIGVYSFFS